MRRLCLFCNNPADSKEDVIPVWIQEKVKGKWPITVNGFSGSRNITLQAMKSNFKTTCVCSVCNKGWMSRLGGQAKKILGPLMEDINLPLDGDQQIVVAKWAVKTAMTSEALKGQNKTTFFTRYECSQFKELGIFPTPALVCLGRYAGSDMEIGVSGIDGWQNNSEHLGAPDSYTATFIFKRVVIQVVSVHVGDSLPVDMLSRPGPWKQALLEIVPSKRIIFWPPRLSFDDRGPLSLHSLVNRFSIGVSE